MDLRTLVIEILDKHATKRVNGNVAADLTTKQTYQVTLHFIDVLHKLGFLVQHPKNIGQRHLEAAFQYWFKEKSLKPKTLESYASRLRIFFGYIGQPNLVKDFRNYLPDVPEEQLKISRAAEQSKSLSANGIHLVDLIMRADALDWRLGLMIRIALAFGLRRKGLVRLNPFKADHGTHLVLVKGENKGSGGAVILVKTAEQRAVLELVKARLGKSGQLGWGSNQDGSRATHRQNEKRYSDLMGDLGITKKKCGVTPHGLRAQFAENQALLAAMIPPTLGGTKNQAPKEELDIKRRQVSEMLAHHRPDITNAYYGSFHTAPKQEIPLTELMRKALGVLSEGMLELPTVARLDDCRKICTAALEKGIDLRMAEAHALWKAVSARKGIEWTVVDGDIELQLRVAAFDMVMSEMKRTDNLTGTNLNELRGSGGLAS